MARNTAIKVSNLTHTVTSNTGNLTILKGINMEIKESESVAIVGSSGSGKSTLLGLLAGLDVNTSGDIFLYEQEFSSQTEEQRALARGQYVGFVFQSFHLLPSLQAIENVMLPAELKGDKDARKKAEVLLEKVGLSHRLTHYPNQLSGGEQQRVAIARAFASNPKILFADEPTGNLDEENGKLIIKLLFDLNQSQGTTLVMVTHDNELAKMCDRQLVMSAGQLTEKSL
ncbi:MULTISPECIES: ABC transporter ATP-binding protein [Marinomonas]|jgi:putative ABC transport system ATP-binding protein|uniref:Putative ABC transport system ATP-binding protein n=1 Tax=Marinomonas polaris DSM 16579 TaxID=1122206 RepID=A0A1M4ZNN8_9GAMM|nr:MULTISPECIES: ABC transporter ATP-binding protein [Marinomonas]PJE56982.1 ABC transporter [Marinomonas sp. BSi20584]SHF19614.1 putative ABC transport system ATP-binding protein [Marinomonas polaris DSM 16579]|tara:strand:- start:14521 stop:15204 length:684 start_codon:yes stop_codon:yes gene_type:complete